MTKPIVWDPADYANRWRMMRRLRQRPKVMWFKTEKGNVRMLNPRPADPLDDFMGWSGIIEGTAMVRPRYTGAAMING